MYRECAVNITFDWCSETTQPPSSPDRPPARRDARKPKGIRSTEPAQRLSRDWCADTGQDYAGEWRNAFMRRSAEVIILVGVLALSGCATKKYVQQRVDERGAQLDEKVGKVDQAQQGTQRQLEGDEPKISAGDEKASAADSRASDAIGRADAASKKADQVKSDLRNELN